MIWSFGLSFLGLHDALDEGSQQWHEALLVLNRLCEILQHSDTDIFRLWYFPLCETCVTFSVDDIFQAATFRSHAIPTFSGYWQDSLFFLISAGSLSPEPDPGLQEWLPLPAEACPCHRRPKTRPRSPRGQWGQITTTFGLWAATNVNPDKKGFATRWNSARTRCQCEALEPEWKHCWFAMLLVPSL